MVLRRPCDDKPFANQTVAANPFVTVGAKKPVHHVELCDAWPFANQTVAASPFVTGGTKQLVELCDARPFANQNVAASPFATVGAEKPVQPVEFSDSRGDTGLFANQSKPDMDMLLAFSILL